MNPVVITADRTCDLSADQLSENGVRTIPYHIILQDKEYFDNVDITPPEIYQVFYDTKELPHTSAVSMGEYLDFFEPALKEGKDIVHVTLGSKLSASYVNATLAAEEIGDGRVQVVDSKSLSSGTGLLVLRACDLAREGLSAEAIAEDLRAHVVKTHASFVMDTLQFMAAGGRCSSVAAFGANLLKLKPLIGVDPLEDGAMGVVKKYRGDLGTVIDTYVRETLNKYDDLDTRRIFITHSTIDKKYVEIAEKAIRETKPFEHIYETVASCTISSPCGPGTLGVLFMTK